MNGTGVAAAAVEPESLHGLKSRADRVFEESREAMRTAVVLRLQSDFLKRRLGRSLAVGIVSPTVLPQPAETTPLSPREIAVLHLIVEGRTTRQIAPALLESLSRPLPRIGRISWLNSMPPTAGGRPRGISAWNCGSLDSPWFRTSPDAAANRSNIPGSLRLK